MEGIGDGELGLQLVGPDEIRDLKREHLGIDEETDALAFPIDGRDELPAGCRVSSATSCSARRWSATPGVLRSCTPCCTSSATTTARRWKRESGLTHEDAAPSVIESFNYAIEGHDPRVADAAQHAASTSPPPSR